MSFLAAALVAKRLELLKEALPGASRVVVLEHRAFCEGTMRDMLQETEGAARALGVPSELLEVRGATELI